MKTQRMNLTFFKHLLIIVCCFVYNAQTINSQYVQKTNLPTIYIETDENKPIVSKDDYLSARIVIRSGDATEDLDVTTEVRGRGNSTWGLAKKPYRIKLNKKYNILNLPAKAKSWTLLANYADKTLIRNAVAFKISEILEMEFSPSARFVDLVLNGTYLGNYMLSDQVQVGANRVDIDELTSKDIEPSSITGGYLLEIDGFADSEPEWFTSSNGLKITIKSPDEDEITNDQRSYIVSFVNEFEKRLNSADFADADKGYRSRVDTTSLINWYIGCELTGNPDSFWSTYVYKKRGVDKLFFGPMWDYDIAFNNDNRQGDAVEKLMLENAYNKETAWVTRMYKDEWFKKAVWNRWTELLEKGLRDDLIVHVDDLTKYLDESQKLNFQLWGDLNKMVYREQFLFDTYSQGTDYLKSYINRRIDFLTKRFEYIEPSAPFVAEEAYYMIKNKKSGNVISLPDGDIASNLELLLWEPRTDDDTQLWDIAKVGGEDIYRFVNKSSSKVIMGNGRNRSLTQAPIDENSSSQKWTIVPVNTGNVYSIVNVASDFSMNNSGGALLNGNPVIEYDKGITFNGSYNVVSSENRQWFLEKVKMKENSSIEESNEMEVVPNIYPNPVSDILYIDIVAEKNEFVSFIVNELSGKIIISEQYNLLEGRNLLNLSVSDLHTGVYLLSIQTMSGRFSVNKIFIKR